MQSSIISERLSEIDAHLCFIYEKNACTVYTNRARNDTFLKMSFFDMKSATHNNDFYIIQQVMFLASFDEIFIKIRCRTVKGQSFEISEFGQFYS